MLFQWIRTAQHMAFSIADDVLASCMALLFKENLCLIIHEEWMHNNSHLNINECQQQNVFYVRNNK